jgi:pimeloyl-ACP methyl ester carboxylesterase
MPIDARKVILAPEGGPPTPTGIAISGMRLGFRALVAVSPGLAARLATQLWFRPPRPRIHPVSREFMKTGNRSTMLVRGRPIATWTWGTGPAVLLVHGWGGYGGQMQAFVVPLVRAGYQAIVFDAPAHGASGPSQLGQRRTTLFDFAYAVDAIGSDRNGLAGIIAHSGGCTAVALALLTAEWQAQSLAFIAPMASPSAYRTIFHRALGLPENVERRFTELTSRRFDFRWEDLEVPGMAARMKTPPLLVVHDRNDMETSWAEGAAIAEAWPQSLMQTTEGLGHRRVLRDQTVVEAVTSFVTRPTPGRVATERAQR